MRFLICILSISVLTGCKKDVDYYHLETFSTDNKLRAVIEIPAGTNRKVEFNPTSHQFEIDKENGQDRVIKYLPYPSNYGFIPSTLSKVHEGGDGDALDILVLSPSVPVGTVLEVLPIGVLKLIDNGEQDYKIIAIPLDTKLKTINATSLNQLNLEHKEVLVIIEKWFLNYNPKDPAESQGWGTKDEALRIIKASSL